MYNQYEIFLAHIRADGVAKSDRTGTGTKSIFGYQMKFDLQYGFPLVTTKKLHVKSIVAELLWFLSGSTNVKDLQAQGVRIWDEWARPDGELGPIYGAQWRSWPVYPAGPESNWESHIDQISNVISQIKANPDSRRLIVSAWNVAQLPAMALEPCHCLFQFYVANGRLSLQLYQRSADAFLGVPFNIASYALLLRIVARECDLLPGEFVWTGGDCHIYDNHTAQVDLQLSRRPKPFPRLIFTGPKPDSLFGYKPEDFDFEGYDPHPAIAAKVAV